jgi:UPF0755 protein
MIVENPKTNLNNARLSKYLLFFGIFFALVFFTLFFVYVSLSRPPADFPVNGEVTITPGSNVRTIINQFAENKLVRSKIILYLTIMTLYETNNIKAGTYYFGNPIKVTEVARIITEVGPKDQIVTLTIPEGTSAKNIAKIAKQLLINFDEVTFNELAKDKEGYLFPDTYFVPTHYTTEQLFSLLTKTFEEKMLPVINLPNNTNLTDDQVIILASILEREANSPESMSLVSGVLQNRLAIEMPLQADATIEYVLDKPLKELVPEDLEIESPYNTYLNLGLPPTPIGNPGLDAVSAVLNPEPSDYYYYITDPDGNFHFAKTFDQHKVNIARYLR